MATGEHGFMGTGWSLGASGLGLDPKGAIVTASGDEKIRQSILILLSTAPGERIGRPDFGCGIHDLVFAPRTAATLGGIIRSVTTALERWEPRIALLSVSADPHPALADAVLVQIHYEVRATTNRFNLVYPFYLST